MILNLDDFENAESVLTNDGYARKIEDAENNVIFEADCEDVNRTFMNRTTVPTIAKRDAAVVKSIHGKTIVSNQTLISFNGNSILSLDSNNDVVDLCTLPISSYFADGMKSAGNAYDELTPTKAIKRIKSVKLKDLNWTRLTSYGTNPFFYAPVSDRPMRDDLNIQCAEYTPRGKGNYALNSFGNNAIDMQCSGGATSGRIYIRDDRYTTTAQLISAMGETVFYYETNEPIETAITPPLDMHYIVENGGKEFLQPNNASVTTEFNGVIEYVKQKATAE